MTDKEKKELEEKQKVKQKEEEARAAAQSLRENMSLEKSKEKNKELESKVQENPYLPDEIRRLGLDKYIVPDDVKEAQVFDKSNIDAEFAKLRKGQGIPDDIEIDQDKFMKEPKPYFFKEADRIEKKKEAERKTREYERGSRSHGRHFSHSEQSYDSDASSGIRTMVDSRDDTVSMQYDGR